MAFATDANKWEDKLGRPIIWRLAINASLVFPERDLVTSEKVRLLDACG